MTQDSLLEQQELQEEKQEQLEQQALAKKEEHGELQVEKRVAEVVLEVLDVKRILDDHLLLLYGPSSQRLEQRTPLLALLCTLILSFLGKVFIKSKRKENQNSNQTNHRQR